MYILMPPLYEEGPHLKTSLTPSMVTIVLSLGIGSPNTIVLLIGNLPTMIA